MRSSEIRSKFLDFFKKHNHKIVRSSSLVPRDDPTLLFINAGMAQFKRMFLGEEKRDYTSAATSQKCVRAGGKHNDLENVGYTARHHTFFEMLGNFSFGDYFKEKAIEFAWDLLTNGYGLPAEKLRVSIFREDDESERLWLRQTGISPEGIIRLNEDDNFWSMGDTGPCGPCSEIYTDRGERFGCKRPGCAPGCDCERYLELWNLVFMQFSREPSGEMTPLSKPCIDTGLGLERIASVLQNAETNFEIDLISPVIKKTEDISKTGFNSSEKAGVAMKVISDHSRAAAFLIGDGVLPSNEGRGYVLRRIMRRAIRYGRNIGLKKPFLLKTASTVMDVMSDSYPELKESSSFIVKVIQNEENRFNETIDRGLGLLNETLESLESRGEKVLDGDAVFKLYDTYGFPADIVKDVAREKDIEIDFKGFDEAMSVRRKKSRSKAAFAGTEKAYSRLASKGIKPIFEGYDSVSCDSKVIAVVHDKKNAGVVEVVAEATPFYGESGGQEGDAGVIVGKKFRINVEKTYKDPAGIIIHRGKMTAGDVNEGDVATFSVDIGKRERIARNHTATHLLHYCLRSVLGDHVKQAGSLVGDARLRFDFSHFLKVSEEELDGIEGLANEKILKNLPVKTDEMDAEDAFKSGAAALFEEKYGERVRVVSVGDFSKELCGGTHAGLTGDLGVFKIIGESAVASGVRRIEAVTGLAALTHIQKTYKTVRNLTEIMKTGPDLLIERVEKTLKAQKNLAKENERLKTSIASGGEANSTEDEVRLVKGIKVLAKRVSAGSPSALRDLADRFRDKIGSGVVLLGSVANSRALLAAVVTKDLSDRLHAGEIINEAASAVEGRGGGRPDMAQAGGSNPGKLDDAREGVYAVVEEIYSRK